MKPSAVIMNVAAGPVIDESAMIEALRAKRIRGAALDVFDVGALCLRTVRSGLLTMCCSRRIARIMWRAGWSSAVTFFPRSVSRAGETAKPLWNVVDKAGPGPRPISCGADCQSAADWQSASPKN